MEQGRREDYLAWRAVVVVVCGGWRWRRRCRRWRFSLVLPLFSLSLSVFSFFFPLCSSSFSSFSSLGSFLSIPILLLSSFSLFIFVFFPFLFLCFFLLSLSLPLFSSFLAILLSLSFFFFCSFQSSPLCSSVLVLPSLVPPFLLCPPVFIGKNRGGTWPGWPLCCRPTTAWGARSLLFSPPRGRPRVRGYISGVMVGVFLMLLRERSRWKQREKKSSFSPVLRIQRKKKSYSAVQNDTVLISLFFLWTVHETTPF